MNIFSHVTDIINANVSDLLDKAPDRKQMAQKIIKEMEASLVEVRSSAAKMMAQKIQIERTSKNYIELITKWQEKAKLAIDRGRDDLAKAALFEKKKILNAYNNLKNQEQEIEKTLKRLGSNIYKLEQKLLDTKARIEYLLLRQSNVSSQNELGQILDASEQQAAKESLDLFEKEIDRIDASSSKAALSTQEQLVAEIDDLAELAEIEQELATMKKEIVSEQE